MSPDAKLPAPDAERLVSDAIASAIRRARWLALIEAAAFGLTAAAISPLAGAPIAVAVVVWRWRSISRASILRALEHAHPASRNLLVTADELARETLAARAPVRARVFADAAALAPHLDLRTAFPITRIVPVALLPVLPGPRWRSLTGGPVTCRAPL